MKCLIPDSGWTRTIAPAIVLLFTLFGAAMTTAGMLETVTYSPDITAQFGGIIGNDEDAVIDDLIGPVDLSDVGMVPGETDLTAYHLLTDGDQLISFDTTVILDPLTVQTGDVVRAHFDGKNFIYGLEFDASAEGLPAGVKTDAVSMQLGNLILSFDITVVLNNHVIKDEDLVSFDDTGFSLFFDGSAVGISQALDLDGAHVLGNQIFMSFDGSGTVGKILFNDEDVLAYDTLSGTWRLIYDGSVEFTAWRAADLDALYVSATNACRWDFDNDDDVDGQDCANFAAGFEPAELASFAAEFGRIDCLE
jgi:hypothetical protein